MSLLTATRASLTRSDSNPRYDRSWASALRDAVSQFRRKYLPTNAELEMEYLNGSADLRELEYRMRRLDQARAQWRGGVYQRY
jgi:hypothetical protein